MKNKILKNIFVILLVIGLFFQLNINIVVAKTTNELKSEQNENEQKIDEAKEELENIQTEKSEAMTQVENLTSQISEYQSQIDELDTKITELTNKISESEEQLKQAEEEYTKQEELLEERLVAAYEAGDTSYLDVLLTSADITEFISNYYLVKEIATNDTELLEKIQKQKEEIENAKKELEESKNELEASKASKQEIANSLSASKAEKDAYVAKLSEDEKQTQQELEQLQADNDQITKQLKIAEEKYKKQLEELKNNGASSSGSSSSGGSYNAGTSGFLQSPVKSGSITATMYYSSGKYHGALDYGVSSGTTVYAAADGVVYIAGYAAGSYGYYVVIQHTNGLRTYYAHGNGNFYVSAGQTVSKGQAIMQSGNSGKSTGPHLHFEVRVSPYTWYSNGNDSRRDPRNYM